MKLKINLPLIVISSFLLLPPFAFTADDSDINPNNTEILVHRSPLDSLLTIDDLRLMEEQDVDSPMSQQERDSWLQFKQMFAKMEWGGLKITVVFSLDENNQLRCYHSLEHSPFNCIDMIQQMFSSIKRAKEKDILTVRQADRIVIDFILQELKTTKTAEQLRANIEQFMKENGFNDLVFDISVVLSRIIQLEAYDKGNATSLHMSVVFPQGTEQSLLDYNGEVTIKGTIDTILPCLEGLKYFKCKAQLAFGNITASHCTINDHNIDLRIFVKRGEGLKETYSIAGIEVHADQACFQQSQ